MTRRFNSECWRGPGNEGVGTLAAPRAHCFLRPWGAGGVGRTAGAQPRTHGEAAAQGTNPRGSFLLSVQQVLERKPRFPPVGSPVKRASVLWDRKQSEGTNRRTFGHVASSQNEIPAQDHQYTLKVQAQKTVLHISQGTHIYRE